MEEQSDNKRSINVTDGNETFDDKPAMPKEGSLEQGAPAPDKLAEIESENATTFPVAEAAPAPEETKTQNELTAANTALAREKTKRRSKPGLVLLLGLIMALVGAAAGIFVYKAYFEKASTPGATVSTPAVTTTEPKSTVSATSLVDNTKSALKGAVVPATFNEDGYAFTDDKMAAFSVPRYQSNGYDFYTVPKTYVGVTSASNNKDESDKDILAIRKLTLANKLSATGVRFDAGNSVLSTADYFSAGVICRDEQTQYSYKAGKYQVHFACADTSSYTDNAKTLQPLYVAYKTDKPDVAVPGLMLGLARIYQSKTTGYQIAHVATGNIYMPASGSVVHFYQTPDKTWHYFMNSQDTIACSAYNTADLKKAFLDETCANGAATATVR